ncbi:MAG: hypothetical protein ACYC9S_12470 [Leptospirales bacterium]
MAQPLKSHLATFNMIFQDSSKMIGHTEFRLFDKLGNPKKMFKDNFLWKILKKFNLDLQIPLITGYWTLSPIKRNTVTSLGKQVTAKQLNGVSTTPATALAIGTGTPSATALGVEATTNGGGRGAATCTNTTTTTTGDTAQWVKPWSFTGSLAITEEGIFDNVTSGGNLVASQSFSVINAVSGDSLQVTHQLKFS